MDLAMFKVQLIHTKMCMAYLTEHQICNPMAWFQYPPMFSLLFNIFDKFTKL